MATRKAFPLRISPDLYEALRRLAEAEFRSVNGQIEYLLREALRRRENPPSPQTDDRPPATDDGS